MKSLTLVLAATLLGGACGAQPTQTTKTATKRQGERAPAGVDGVGTSTSTSTSTSTTTGDTKGTTGDTKGTTADTAD